MKTNILVIDTDYTRALLRKKIEEQNHKVVTETRFYNEGLELYKTFTPDILILDIDLESTGSGLEFLEQLLEMDPSAQVIALSSFFENKTKAKLFKLGIERLVMKPYQPAHIWEQIDDICNTYNILDMREKREVLLNSKSMETQQSKGDALNNQILSLREQISRNRNQTNTSSTSKDSYDEQILNSELNEDILLEKDLDFNEKHNTNNIESNHQSYFPQEYYSSLDDYENTNFDIDELPDIEHASNEVFDTYEDFSSNNATIRYDKTDISNNIHSSDISLSDTHMYNEYSDGDDIKIDSELTSYSEDNLQTSKGYLNLPIFLNRENAFGDDDEAYYNDVNRETDNGSNKSQMFNRFFKKK